MNKFKRMVLKAVRIILITFLIFFILWLVGIVIYRLDTGGSLHTYVNIGDGRFDISIDGSDGRRFFVDNKPIGSDTIVSRVERYYIVGDYIYVQGYHSDTGVNTENPRFPSFASLVNKEKRILYYSLDEIPRYIVLNHKTADMRLYKTLDEVPEEQQKYFTKKINFWCDLFKTCYEAEEKNP